MRTTTLSVTILLLLFLSCNQPAEFGSAEQIKKITAGVDDQRLRNADKTPGDWLSNGRNYAEDRYSELEQVNKENIKSLGLAWSLNLGTTRGIEATPIVVNGIMYLSGPWSKVFAINAVSGQLIWTYDPLVPGYYGRKACCDVVNRGVALYKGKVYVGTLDGRLVAIDAADGKKVWEVATVDSTKPYTITGAPRVADGKVIIGNGGADYGVRGYVTAYDAETGKQAWRFYTVPGDPSKPFESEEMKMAASTWDGKWWAYGGGGTAWDGMAYDPDLKLLYVGTGNGSPWSRYSRSDGKGDNLFLASILAINPDNGKLVWYYQTTPGEQWDYTAVQPMILADLLIKGEPRKVIMQAPKNGIFYVIDRTNGKLISAKPYTYINWATGVDSATGRPIETDFARYKDQNVEIFPSPFGAHNWQAMSFNKKNQLMYLTVRDMSLIYGQNAKWEYNSPSDFGSGIGWNTAIAYDASKPLRTDTTNPYKASMERLVAWDPVNQKQVWSVPLKGWWNGGVLTTSAGLVFEATADGMFTAFDADNGKVIWQKDLGTGAIAPPITYTIGDTQYVSIACGWGGVGGLSSKFTKQINPGTVYTFALNRNTAMPAYPPPRVAKLIDLPVTAGKEQIQHGGLLFLQYCASCHSTPGDGGGSIPDLAYSSEGTFGILNDILLKGMYLKKGMANFSDKLNATDVNDIKNFILATAKEKAKK